MARKASGFVTKGETEKKSGSPSFGREEQLPIAPLSSRSHPADLPRDYGMAGAVGSYEVKPWRRFVNDAMQTLCADMLQTSTPHAEETVRTVLNTLLPPAEHHRLAVEQVTESEVVLSLAQKSDRFLYSRTIVPKLQRALRSTLGYIHIRLVDRLT